MPDGVHAEIYPKESNTSVHNGEFEGFCDARDAEEVCLVADEKPDA